jgi:uncharacterized tellurite resistance protein B-like protein
MPDKKDIRFGKFIIQIEDGNEDRLVEGEDQGEYSNDSHIDNIVFERYDPNSEKIGPQKELIKQAIREKNSLSDPKQYREIYPGFYSALITVAYLAVEGNTEAVEFVQSLLEKDELDLSDKVYLIRHLRKIKDDKIIDLLMNILRTTKSNNTTRRLITETLKTIASTERKELIQSLYEIMNSNNFSYKMKGKILRVIEILKGNEDLYYERI